MWKITLAGAIAIGFAAATGEPALACDRCDGGYFATSYYYPYPKRSRVGIHEYYGFYDSCYKADADGGYYSAVGRDCNARSGKHRTRVRRHR